MLLPISLYIFILYLKMASRGGLIIFNLCRLIWKKPKHYDTLTPKLLSKVISS